MRQQAARENNSTYLSLADFIAPATTGLPDHLGAFAVTTGIGLKELCDEFRAQHDDYNAIMAEALADRLAEAFAECLHERARRQWGYGGDERWTKNELLKEEYRGIRPAAGYPACPDHTEKGILWRLLDVEAQTGMLLTESFAMWPGSSVSGLYFAHPNARYFTLGKIDRDQVDDYHRRKNMSITEVERWLGPNLNYEPATALRAAAAQIISLRCEGIVSAIRITPHVSIRSGFVAGDSGGQSAGARGWMWKEEPFFARRLAERIPHVDAVDRVDLQIPGPPHLRFWAAA